jgi:hypothetical protein
MKKFKVTFEVEIDISNIEVDTIRKENRSFLTHGFFAKDQNIAKIAAYNKALERIIKGDVINYNITPLDKTKI